MRIAKRKIEFNYSAAMAQFIFAHGLVDKWDHLNVRTPRWTGYFLFRPEQHRLHHAVRGFNFGFLPFWDLLFGTFRNPDSEIERVGFPDAAQSKFWPIFLDRKVQTSVEGAS